MYLPFYFLVLLKIVFRMACNFLSFLSCRKEEMESDIAV